MSSTRERALTDVPTGAGPVLLVDPDPIARSVFSQCLRRAGREVVVLGDGNLAWDMLCTDHDFRTVIVDQHAPGVDGPELVRRLRARRDGNYAYAIITTRSSAQEDLKRAVASGADDVLVKPFLFEALVQRLEVAARISALEDKLARRNRVLEAYQRRNRQTLEAAARVQRTLLPARAPDLHGVATAWLYQPCEELGGDLLNLLPLDDRHLAFWVLDVSGHGVSSALLAVQVSRFLAPTLGQESLIRPSSASGTRIAPPHEVLERLNALFPMDRQTRHYLTIVYGILDASTGEVTYACAGHPGPLVVRADGGCERLDRPGVAIGWLPEGQAHYADGHFTLAPGERLYCYSDGVTEACDAHERGFGVHRLAAILATARALPLADSLATLAGELARWSGEDAEGGDDVSILAIARADIAAGGNP